MKLFCIGKAVKLHGYKGEIKIITRFDDNFDVKIIEKLFDESGKAYEIENIFKINDGIVVSFVGVDLEMAKTLINKWFYINRVILGEKIMIEDLKDSIVFFTDGTEVGKITDVQDFGTAEVFYVQTKEGKEVLFPNVKGLINSFCYKTKTLIIYKERFNEVCVDEN